MLTRATLLTLLTLMTACSTLEFPGVYRLPIEQGNIITEEMVAQLEPGMSRSQVEFVLGTALVQDTFHPDRWDYIYRIRHSDKSIERKRLSVFFENDRLSRYATTVVPTPGDDGDESKVARDEETEDLAEEAEERARELRKDIEKGEQPTAKERPEGGVEPQEPVGEPSP